MIDDKILKEFQETHEDANLVPVNDTEPKTLSVDSVVKEQEQKNLEEIKSQDSFISKSKEVTARQVANDLRKQANIVLSEEHQRELEEYTLKKQKEELDYRTKLEKNIIKEEVKADVYTKRRKIAEQRYGYLYETTEVTTLNEKNEEVKSKVYKDFTPNKFINRFKEFRNWYSNLSDEVKKIINKTCTTVLKLSFWVALGFCVYGLIKWLLTSGLIVV